MVDDSHATGFVGKTGRGTPEHFGVADRVDVVNSTLGKALGGASGGYSTGRQEIIDVLRQRSRPYIFSNAVAPGVIGASLEVFNILRTTADLPAKLLQNTVRFRTAMKSLGFTLAGMNESPIAPVMIGDARLAAEFAEDMLKLGIYVIGFSFPVVPRDQARIRVQLSAAHSFEQIDRAVDAFQQIGKRKGIL